jgi:hypothetical protein
MDFFSDTVNKIASFLDKILINKNFVLILLIFVMGVMSVFIVTYLWEKSKVKATSRSQKSQFVRSFILMILSFLVIIFSYIGVSDFYINSNLITEIDEVVLVEKGMKNIRIGKDGYASFATDGVKLIGKRGYSVNVYKEKPSFNQAFFDNNRLKGTNVNVNNNVYRDLNDLSKEPTNIRLKYYFYKSCDKTPRIIVVESVE